jgi:hypothetical protein
LQKLSPEEAAHLQQDLEQSVNQKSASAWNAVSGLCRRGAMQDGGVDTDDSKRVLS